MNANPKPRAGENAPMMVEYDPANPPAIIVELERLKAQKRELIFALQALCNREMSLARAKEILAKFR